MKQKFLQLTHKSLDELGAPTYKELWSLAKKEGYEGLAISVKTVFTKGNENRFHATFSTDSVDRHGDVVKQEPDLRMFKKNPVYLDSHNYDSIEHIIGKVAGISVKTGQLEGDVEFFLDNPRGMLAMKAADQGYLNASSIGFIPHAFDEKSGAITEWELLEISAVSVPAQPEALFEKSMKLGEYEVTKGENGEMSYTIGKITYKVKLAEEENMILCDKCGKAVPFNEAKELPTDEKIDLGGAEVGVFLLICAECDEKLKAEAEPEPQPIAPAEPKKVTAASVIVRLAQEDKRQMKVLARALEGMTQEDRSRSRRKLLKAIRSIIKSTSV